MDYGLREIIFAEQILLVFCTANLGIINADTQTTTRGLEYFGGCS